MAQALTPMLADIARQPEVLSQLLGRAQAFLNVGAAHLTPLPGGRLFVTGCGDGIFAADAAAAHAEALGLDWRPIGALDLVLSADRLRPADRVIAISMSGNVDRTVEAARAVADRGVPLVALVNGKGGRLGEIAASKISLDLSDIAPFLCGTASYTATLLALMMLASGAMKQPAPSISSVINGRDDVGERVASIVASMGSAPSGVRLLSAGADMGTVRYGAAKFVELTRIPAWSGDLEEFAHSQYWAMPASDLVIIVASSPALADYAEASCAALAQLGVTTIAIDLENAPVTSAAHRITLPSASPAAVPLLTAVPLQHLAYRLAERTGLDPNTRIHLKSDETRFKVSRMLTRRSLIGTGQ